MNRFFLYLSLCSVGLAVLLQLQIPYLLVLGKCILILCDLLAILANTCLIVLAKLLEQQLLFILLLPIACEEGRAFPLLLRL